MKFRYYITEIFNGQIVGTDDPTIAHDLAESEEYFIVDTETGLWIQTEDKTVEIEEVL